MRALSLSVGLLTLLCLAACRTSGGPRLADIAASINRTLHADGSVLGIGDEFEVRFAKQPDWDQSLQVAPDGTATFVGVGTLPVAGLSVAGLRTNLIAAYAHVVEDPELDVLFTGAGARTVYVMGEVEEPGAYELDADRHLTFLEALAMAGGPIKETAYLEHTLLVRFDPTTRAQLSWKIDAAEEHWIGTEPLYLQAYDVVFIPNSPVDDVAIWIDNYIRRMIPFPYLSPGG